MIKDMANKIEYITEPELTDLVSDVLTNENYADLKSLRQNDVVILSCMKIHMDDNSEYVKCKGNPVALKKVGDMERIFMTDSAHFILVFDMGVWEGSSATERKYHVYRTLVAMSAEMKGEKLVFTKHKPDVVEHLSTLTLFSGKVENLRNLEAIFGTAAQTTVTMISKKIVKKPAPALAENDVPEEDLAPA